MKQISFVWVMRYWRECKSHHDLITWSLWISKFSNIFCDINDSISMNFDCRKFIKYVNDVSQTENDREIDKKRNVSMQRMQNRIFLIWLKFVKESNRLVCEKIRYFQHYLFFLIEFLLFSWSNFCFAKSRCNNCIVRFFETILCDFKVVFVQYAFSKLYCRVCEYFDQYILSKLYCLIDCFSFILAIVLVFSLFRIYRAIEVSKIIKKETIS